MFQNSTIRNNAVPIAIEPEKAYTNLDGNFKNNQQPRTANAIEKPIVKLEAGIPKLKNPGNYAQPCPQLLAYQPR